LFCSPNPAGKFQAPNHKHQALGFGFWILEFALGTARGRKTSLPAFGGRRNGA